MITNPYNIRRNLQLISGRFDVVMGSSRIEDSVEAALCAKLALMELCGWIEETIDALLFDYVERKVPSKALQDVIKKEVIDTVYGFRYKQDFRPLMEKIIGVDKFQKILLRLHKKRMRDEMLKQTLTELSKERNRAAHTHWQPGITPIFQAPSKTVESFLLLYPIIKSLERMLHNL